MNWKPIEDLWFSSDDHDLIIVFVPGTGVTVGEPGSGEFVIDVINGCRETYATHWMPLPDPPSA